MFIRLLSRIQQPTSTLVLRRAFAMQPVTLRWTQRPSFSTSSHVNIEGKPEDKNDPKIVKTTDKSTISAILEENPALLESVYQFIDLAKEEGVDLTNPNPSFSSLVKLASNQKIKDAANNLRKQFEASGIQISREDAMKMLGQLPK